MFFGGLVVVFKCTGVELDKICHHTCSQIFVAYYSWFIIEIYPQIATRLNRSFRTQNEL
mgnify:CR=1 FL=1